MKTYVVIGLSTFGQYMVKYLAQKQINVVAIDLNERRIDAVKEWLSKGVIGNAKDRTVLEKLGVRDCEGVILSLGSNINDSIILLLYLKEMEVAQVYIKVHDEDHAKIASLIHTAEVIFPERDSAYVLAQKIDNPNVLDYVPLGTDSSIVDWIPAPSLIGKRLGETCLKKDYNVKIVSVQQTEPENTKVVPNGNYVVKESDVLVLIGANEDLERLKKLK